MHSSSEIREHLSRVVSLATPGSRLPTDREVAERFGVSLRTVARVMGDLARKGLVRRVRGKGTFVPDAAAKPTLDAEALVHTPQPPLIEQVFGLICNGEYRRGEALPSVKYLSRRFHVAPATVVQAYRELCARRVVTKVGKTFWVGGFRALLRPRNGREVFFLVKNHETLERLFDEATFGGRAFRVLDDTLADAGCLVHYRFVSEFGWLFEQWGRSGRLPLGLVLVDGDEMTLGDWPPELREIVRKQRLREIAVVLDWAGGWAPGITRAECVLSHSHTATVVSRALARFMTTGGFSATTFFVDTALLEYALGTLFDYLRTFSEAQHLQAGYPCALMVLGRSPQLFDRVPPAVADSLLGKYSPLPFAELRARHVDEADSPAQAFAHVWERDQHHARRVAGPLWVFASDELATHALTWAQQRRIRVPRQLNLISLQSGTRYYSYGLSRCSPDWENAGYLMAHALLGDLPIPHSHRGYLDFPARIRENQTTPWAGVVQSG